MMRFISKWFISRSIDCDLPLPAWVVDRIDKDRHLNDYYQRSLRLAKLLRDEPSIVESVQGSRSEFSKQAPQLDLPRPVWYQTSLRTAMICSGLAATIALAYTSWSLLPVSSKKGQGNSRNSELVVQTDPPSKEFPSKLKSKAQQVVQSSREIMEKLQNNSREIADSLVNAEELVALFKSSNESTGSTYVSAFVDSTGDMGARYGQVLNTLGEHCQSENEQWMSNGADAVRYFVRDLPLHAIKLAGM